MQRSAITNSEANEEAKPYGIHYVGILIDELNHIRADFYNKSDITMVVSVCPGGPMDKASAS